jgi:hypothetical protein
VTSAAPTWRDASAALAILSGLYLIIQAVVSFGVGGYIAGRTRTAGAASHIGEIEHRDGVHGLAAWALAVVLGTLLATLVGSAALTRSNASLPAARTSAAEPLLSYELDRLFRPVRRAANLDLAAERAEAGRILLTSSSHSGMANEDRAYLAQLVAATTGLAGPDAEKRADTAIANAHTAIARSRRSTVILGFSVAAALLLGAVTAWTAAAAGGRHRDGSPMPHWLGEAPLWKVDKNWETLDIDGRAAFRWSRFVKSPVCEAWPMVVTTRNSSWFSQQTLAFICPKCHFKASENILRTHK